MLDGEIVKEFGDSSFCQTGPGHMANKGADGFVLVFWDKPEA